MPPTQAWDCQQHSSAWENHQGAVPPRQRPPWGKIPAWRVAHGLTHKAVNFFWAGAPLAEGPHASAPAHVCAQASRWFALKSPLQKYTFSQALCLFWPKLPLGRISHTRGATRSCTPAP